MSIYKDIFVDDLKTKLLVNNKPYYSDFKEFKRTFWSRAVKKIIETTEFSNIEMEIIERRKRKAHKVRISYEYSDQRKHFKDAGFMLGGDKKSKVDKNMSNSINDATEVKSSNQDELKQINGRFYDRLSAKAAGYDWEEY